MLVNLRWFPLTSMTTLLNSYNSFRERILSYFGYEEYWRIFPIINLTDTYWAYRGPHLIYCDRPLTEEVMREGHHVEASYYWTDETINTYRYIKEDYTLFVLKSHLDIMPTLSIFDNSKHMDLGVSV